MQAGAWVKRIVRRGEADKIAYMQRLPFGPDGIAILHAQAQQPVFHPQIAVHAAPVYAQLDQPGPDRLNRCADGDGFGGDKRWVGDKLISAR
jgi:hypothetical protein